MTTNMKLLIETLKEMKKEYEKAIRNRTYTKLIRSRKLIEILHQYAKKELEERFPSSWISMDKRVYGYPKIKTQDILIQPLQDDKKSVSTGPIVSVNIRSQLSSIEKNYDTLFERLFAEALNLHNRFPYLVLGYLYLLPKIGYDDKAAKNGEVRFGERYNMEKYILSLLSINDRRDPSDVPWKYERVALLIVDFEKDPPQVIDDVKTLASQGLISEDFANLFSFKPISIRGFFDEIKKTAVERYYLLLRSR